MISEKVEPPYIQPFENQVNYSGSSSAGTKELAGTKEGILIDSSEYRIEQQTDITDGNAPDLLTSEEHYPNMVDYLLGVKAALRDLRHSVNRPSTDAPIAKDKIVLSPNVIRGKGRS
ncbi:uncharacterized protein LOC122294866 [Carya illinoinensis]|uniref:uncharacterized protein LOC122294866 n=1 Tax=Carya illinoinensis TaxID=32201 RepID=UPI001C71E53D|nr:uncharacterized protein LOC122294866 [Carya illinoinensis]